MPKLENIMKEIETWSRLKGLVEAQLDHTENLLNYRSPRELLNQIDLSISEEGLELDQLFEHVENFIKYVPNTIHPQFNNQLYGGFEYSSFLSEAISFLTNTSMSTYEISPVWT